METYFASPERTTAERLAEEINIINNSQLMQVFLNSISGLLAVLDENRQIVSINDEYMKTLGIEDPKVIEGLRPGESLNCVHAGDGPAGCGTSRYCRTCGAAIAITVSMANDISEERECAIERESQGVKSDLFLKVKCEPVKLDDSQFYLLFINDRTREQKRKMLERTFFHDFSNILGGLATASYMLKKGIRSERVFESIDTTTNVLIKEIEVQRCLLNDDLEYYAASFDEVKVDKLFGKLDDIFSEKVIAEGKELHFQLDPHMNTVYSDETMLIRVISNMITNALEATKEGGRVLVFNEHAEGAKKLSVHNSEYIPDDVQLRVFQKNFTTKNGGGRGIGTYSMKLFGEQLLKGDVGFVSSPHWGTEFFLKLPT